MVTKKGWLSKQITASPAGLDAMTPRSHPSTSQSVSSSEPAWWVRDVVLALILLLLGVALTWFLDDRRSMREAKAADLDFVRTALLFPDGPRHFAGLDLSEQDLSRLPLEATNLKGANLSGADLTFTILSDASLQEADLTDVIAYGTDFTGADLRGADMTGLATSPVNVLIPDYANDGSASTALLPTRIEGVCWDAETVWPEDMTTPPPRDCSGWSDRWRPVKGEPSPSTGGLSTATPSSSESAK